MAPESQQTPFTHWLMPFLTVMVLAWCTYQLTKWVTAPAAQFSITAERTQPEAPAIPEPTPSPTPIPIGLSREHPLPRTGIITLRQWEVQVLDIIRGDDAWQRIKNANQFNDPPYEGWEYVLIRFHIVHKTRGFEEVSLGLHLTGSGNLTYFSFNNSAVPPDPVLNTYLRGQTESEGWEAYLIPKNERDLILIINDLSDYTAPDHYVWLDEGAAFTVPVAALNSIQPTDLGTVPDDPVPFGQMATGADWQMKVLDVTQGKEAWTALQAVNQFTDPPPPGMMYVNVKVQLHYIGTDVEGDMASTSEFDLIGRSGAVYEAAYVARPDPAFLYHHFFPDGQIEGWLTFLVSQTEEELVLLFDPLFSGDDNLRYLSLAHSGR